jgi:two-component system nitrogen regulation response regulator GlnG
MMGRKPKAAAAAKLAEPKKRSEIAVLVVDDEMNLTLAMRRLLSAEGYRTETANSGEEALHKAKESHYDIVFLDVNMPGMNGLETFVKLGQAAPSSAVVMITGYGKTLKAVIEEARTLGVRAVIDKPFKINQITEAIREIIPHAD